MLPIAATRFLIEEEIMFETFPLAASFCIFGAAARTLYELSKKKGKVDTKSVAALAVMAAAMTAFLASWVFMCPADPMRAYSSALASWIGYGIALAGLGLAAGGLATLKGIENVDHLVTTGPFSRIRHPMYSGFVLWIAGWVACHGSAASAAIAVFGIGNILYWRRLEERALECRYGEEYRRYRERTWF
jgi:protein-S-isoprenylcysteine O-methyltransferase Ste14